MTLKEKIARELFEIYCIGLEWKEVKLSCLEHATKILSLLKSEMKKCVPDKKESPKGKDCQCSAYYSGECACGADWSNNDGFNTCRQQMLERIESIQ